MKEIPPPPIALKVYKSRWGCINLRPRIITFNFELAFYPKESLEEVVVHELCHLEEAIHNKHFHELMQYYLSDYKER